LVFPAKTEALYNSEADQSCSNTLWEAHVGGTAYASSHEVTRKY